VAILVAAISMSSAPPAPTNLTGTEAPASPTCGPQNFVVSNLTAQHRWEYLTVTGTVFNGCPILATAKLRFTARNPDGSVKFTSDFFATDYGSRIGPGSQTQFSTVMHAPPGQWPYEVAAVEAITDKP
jgi:hypothetical protein